MVGDELLSPTAVRVLDPDELLDAYRLCTNALLRGPVDAGQRAARNRSTTRAARSVRSAAATWWAPRPRSRPNRGRAVAAGVHLLAAVHTGDAGDDGFLLAEAVGPGPAAELLLADPRDCATTAVDDGTWPRIVDVPTALAARGFAPAQPVLLAGHDPLLRPNSGLYRIAGGAAERVEDLGDAALADLECDVAGLAMAYLGDRAPSELVSTGWWRAADRAAAAFRTARAPWCGTYF